MMPAFWRGKEPGSYSIHKDGCLSSWCIPEDSEEPLVFSPQWKAENGFQYQGRMAVTATEQMHSLAESEGH